MEKTQANNQEKLKSIDNLLLDLKILSQIKEGDKVCTDNNHLSIDNTYFFQGFKRWYTNNSRKTTLDYIETIKKNTLMITSLILKKEKSNNDMVSSDKPFIEGNSELLKKFYLEMIKSCDGLTNLKVTYQTDIPISSKIELIIEKFQERIKQIDDILKIKVS